MKQEPSSKPFIKQILTHFFRKFSIICKALDSHKITDVFTETFHIKF
jgi:hypothetical protein